MVPDIYILRPEAAHDIRLLVVGHYYKLFKLSVVIFHNKYCLAFDRKMLLILAGLKSQFYVNSWP